MLQDQKIIKNFTIVEAYVDQARVKVDYLFIGEWQKSFVIFPVKTLDGKLAWCKTVYKRKLSNRGKTRIKTSLIDLSTLSPVYLTQEELIVRRLKGLENSLP